MRDLDLARVLGFDRERKIRDLIGRLIEAGKIKPQEVCTTPGQTGGRPGKEFWLTRLEAVVVATHRRRSER